jgi:hypothetical protein
MARAALHSRASLRWGELFDGPLFHGDEPARWVLFLAGRDAFLIDRHEWPQGKYLHFELGTLFGRRETAAVRAVAALLHRDALIPEGGTSLLERLDEASHKHAFGVSTDLKWGVQRSCRECTSTTSTRGRTRSKATTPSARAATRALGDGRRRSRLHHQPGPRLD